MKAWVRDNPQRESIGPLPEGVALHFIPIGGPLPEAILDAEFLVPPYGARAVLESLSRMPALKVVQAISAGVEWLLPSVPSGVAVCNAKGLRDIAVAEWVIATVLAIEKRLPDFIFHQRDEHWAPALLPELAGRTMLIVGYGSIGHAVEQRATALGLRVLRVARTAREGVHAIGELSGLLPAADIVVVLVPQTAETRSLFDAETLARMKLGALLVNAARGGVVDTEALLAALRDRRLRAALDVTDPEPLPRGHPLWRAPGVLITPHLAGDTVEAERRVYRFIGDQIRRHAAGQPLLNVVTAPY